MIDIEKARALVERLNNSETAYYESSLATNRELNDDVSDAADTITALLDEVERLRHTPAHEREDLHCVISDLCGQVRDARAERDALARDAARLREGMLHFVEYGYNREVASALAAMKGASDE